MIAAARPGVRLPSPWVLWTITGAWALAIAAQLSGRAAGLHHDGLIEGGLPLWAALGLFLLAWQLMITAMMLPSSLPLINLFFRTSSAQPQPAKVQASFLAGYFVVWTAFGALGFLGDVALHALVDRWGWLLERPQLIGASVLALAGLFQFSDLKERCLRECRHPAVYLMHHYRRGAAEAFRMGRGHGLFCLGCCWALMLVSFAAGVANLTWMAGLTLLMVFEKTGPRGERGVVPIGLGLLALSALVFADPAWLPSPLSADVPHPH